MKWIQPWRRRPLHDQSHQQAPGLSGMFQCGPMAACSVIIESLPYFFYLISGRLVTEAFSLPTQDRIIQGRALQSRDNSLATSLCHVWGFATVSRLSTALSMWLLAAKCSQSGTSTSKQLFCKHLSTYTFYLYTYMCTWYTLLTYYKIKSKTDVKDTNVGVEVLLSTRIPGHGAVLPPGSQLYFGNHWSLHSLPQQDDSFCEIRDCFLLPVVPECLGWCQSHWAP